MSYWKAPSADREGKRVAASPSWSGLAGTPGSFLDSCDRRGRAERAKKRKLFGDSSSSEDENKEDPPEDEDDREEDEDEDEEEEDEEENQSIARLILE